MVHSRRSKRLRYPTKSLLLYFAASSEYRAIEVTLFRIPFGVAPRHALRRKLKAETGRVLISPKRQPNS